MTRQFSLDVGPRDETYRAMLHIATRWCSQGLLVVRPSIELSENADKLIQELKPFVFEQSECASWPGTTLLEGVATVIRFELTPKAISLLVACTSGLYDWQQPQLPEDLCLLRQSGEPWLVSISHEHDGYVVLEEQEFQTLRDELPSFTALLVEDVAT